MINDLNRNGSHDVDVRGDGQPFLDSSGDFRISALDALLVINRLNAATEQVAEAEASASEPTLVVADLPSRAAEQSERPSHETASRRDVETRAEATVAAANRVAQASGRRLASLRMNRDQQVSNPLDELPLDDLALADDLQLDDLAADVAAASR